MEVDKIYQIKQECINNAIRIAPKKETTSGSVMVGSFSETKDVYEVLEIAQKLYDWIIK